MDRAHGRRRFEDILIRRADRRHLLRGGLGAGAAAFAAVSLPGSPTRLRGALARQATPNATPALGNTPFTLGVASGDPLPDGVVLWTRLAPDPLAEDGLGGMDPAPVDVQWEVASDDTFGEVVASGTERAVADLGHSVHVDVTGLEPGREYVYRFTVGDDVSPVGRTKTAPASDSTLDRLRFAFATCQDYQSGFYTPYREMLKDDLDVVFFLGDYIYEGGGDPASLRQHLGGETQTLTDYRLRHALYKTDADLQAVHHAFPWVVTWDDHEVDNDYAAVYGEDGDPIELFAARRAAAYQAYYEHMPLRPASLPSGPDMLLYRKLTFGDLAEFQVLDTRQYRTDHPCGAGEQTPCDLAYAPETTMLGPDQERWLLANLDRSAATWNVLAQQVLMGELQHLPDPQQMFWTDGWDGYPGARQRLLGHIAGNGISNPVVITGDWHCAFVNDLRLDYDDTAAPTIATEFVVTSVSSNGDSTGYEEYYGPMVPYNPHIKYFADRRGYQRVDLTPDRWTTDLVMVDTVTSQEYTAEVAATYVVEAGQPGAVEG
jgi:alkaline phosphatase D